MPLGNEAAAQRRDALAGAQHPLHLERIVARLGQGAPPSQEGFRPRREHAAVALVLAGAPEALHLCFIRRVERETDPWSGHMAFPGGRADLRDASARAVAMRECAEELGLELGGARLLSALPAAPVHIGAQFMGLTLWPFVFYHGEALPALQPQAGEVAQAFWIPLAHLWDAAAQVQVRRRRAGEDFLYRGINFEGQVIWGLTHRVLHGFAARIGAPLRGRGGEKTRVLP